MNGLMKYIATTAVCLFIMSGCSGGGTPAPASYSGDSVSDFVTAIQARDTDKVRQMLDADPGLVELRDAIGQSPLHYAALNNGAGIIELLIGKGMDPNIQDNEGRTPLTVLEDSGFRYEEAREALLDNGGTN